MLVQKPQIRTKILHLRTLCSTTSKATNNATPNKKCKMKLTLPPHHHTQFNGYNWQFNQNNKQIVYSSTDLFGAQFVYRFNFLTLNTKHFHDVFNASSSDSVFISLFLI